MINILINNKQDFLNIDDGFKEFIKKCIKATLDYEKIEKNVQISYLFVDNDEIKKLNKKFRNKDTVTDVLSFPGYEDIKKVNSKILYLGDVVISCKRASKQAKEYNHSIKREIGYLTIHSILHLLGYDHKNDSDKKIMRSKEKDILRSIDLRRWNEKNTYSVINFFFIFSSM